MLPSFSTSMGSGRNAAFQVFNRRARLLIIPTELVADSASCVLRSPDRHRITEATIFNRRIDACIAAAAVTVSGLLIGGPA